MNKHTPGPWRASSVSKTIQYYRSGSEHRKPGWAVLPKEVANLNLQAAAPELLEALKNARALLRGEFGEGFDTEMMDAAIAKAEGRES